MKKSLLALSMMAALSGCGGGEETSTKGGSGNTTPATISFSKSNTEIKEGNSGTTEVKLTIQANRVVDNDVTVTLLAEDGTGKAGKDFVMGDTSVVIRKGSRNVDAVVNIIGNTVHQNNREFKVVLQSVTSSSSVNKGTTDIHTIKISEDDPEPVVNFVNERTMVAEGVGLVKVPVKLDRSSEKVTTVRVSINGLATRDVDYTVESLDLVFDPLVTEKDFEIRIIEDSLIEGTENIGLAMESVINGKAGTIKASTVFIAGDLKLPDTGVTRFYNNGRYDSTVPSSVYPYQDAMYGLDTDPYYASNGYAGFFMQKIDHDGNPMQADTAAHSCVYDNLTGLTWEIKGKINSFPDEWYTDLTDEERAKLLAVFADENWNSKGNVYAWNNPDNKTNGGQVGGFNDKEFDKEPFYSGNCSFPGKVHPLYVDVLRTGCTTNKYIEIYNKSAACGFKDWRLPSIQELMTIANYESGMDFLDGDYFKDMKDKAVPGARYLSSTPSVDNTASVWCYNSDSKSIQLCNKQTYNHVRLVRGPKL